MGAETSKNSVNSTNPYACVQIQYFGSIRVAANKKKEEMEITSSITAYQLLQKLADIHGKDFQGEIFQKNGKIIDDLTVSVNNTIINHSNVADTNLKPGDVISLFPVFPGGG